MTTLKKLIFKKMIHLPFLRKNEMTVTPGFHLLRRAQVFVDISKRDASQNV